MTRNRNPNAVARTNAPRPLPVDSASAGLPVVSEHARLDSELSDLARAFGEDDSPALRRWAPAIDDLRARFRAVDRPAGADEVAREAARLSVTVPLAGNVESGMLADAICELLAERRVTLLELSGVARGVQRRCRFLSVAEVDAELRRVRRRVRRHRVMLENEYSEDGGVRIPMKNYLALFVDMVEEEDDVESAA